MTVTDEPISTGAAVTWTGESVVSHIPVGDVEQNVFRAQVHARLAAVELLGTHGEDDLRDALNAEIAALRADYPDFTPEIDDQLWRWLCPEERSG